MGLVWEVQEAIFSLFFFLNEKSDIDACLEITLLLF